MDEMPENSPFGQVPIEITISVGKARPLVRDLLRLTKDAVLALDRRVDDPVELYVGDRLIARGAALEVDAEAGLPFLIAAVQSKDSGMIDYVLGKGVKVDYKGSQPTTALAVSSNLGELELMKRLIAAGADPNTRARTDSRQDRRLGRLPYRSARRRWRLARQTAPGVHPRA